MVNPPDLSRPRRRGRAALAAAVAAVLGSASLAPAAVAVTYTGTTTLSSSTFDRPVSNGAAAPTDLSDDATATRYQAQTFTVATTGTYDLASAATSPATGATLASFDNFTALYAGTFTAAAPLANVVRANDDDNNVIGVSGQLGVPLTAGQTYTLVTTGATNGDVGSFTNTVAQQQSLASGTTAGAPTWDPFGTGTAIPYTSTPFTVTAAGAYSFLSTAAGFDNFTALYAGAFNASSPDANLVNSNDDSSGTVGLSGFVGQTLAAGTTYYLVTTGTAASASGSYVDTISGPGSAVTSTAVVVAANQTYHFAANTGSGILARTIGGLTVNAGGTAVLDASTSQANRQVLVVNGVGLNLAGSAGAWTGTVNLNNNDVVVTGGSLATITSQAAQGYNGGGWNGTGGIVSTTAAGDTSYLTAVGVIQNNTGSGSALYTTFDGQPVTAADVLVKYTYYGDTNLDGVVNAADYTRADVGFVGGLTGWANGDFNYDGTVDGADYALMDNAFNLQASSLAKRSAVVSAVPEPTAGVLVAAAAIAGLARRSRRPTA